MMKVVFRPSIFPSSTLSLLSEILLIPLISFLIFLLGSSVIYKYKLDPRLSYVGVLCIVILLEYLWKFMNYTNNWIAIEGDLVTIKNSNGHSKINLNKVIKIEKNSFIPGYYMSGNTNSPTKYKVAFKTIDTTHTHEFRQWDKTTVDKAISYIHKTNPRIEIKSESLVTSKDLPTFKNTFK